MPEDNDTSKTGPVRLDQVLTSLSHPTRRWVLATLAERNPRDRDEFTSPDFAVADEDLELFAAEVTYDHLPHLDRAGFIEWDRDADTIIRGPNFEAVRPLIELIHDHREELPEDWLHPDG